MLLLSSTARNVIWWGKLDGVHNQKHFVSDSRQDSQSDCCVHQPATRPKISTLPERKLFEHIVPAETKHAVPYPPREVTDTSWYKRLPKLKRLFTASLLGSSTHCLGVTCGCDTYAMVTVNLKVESKLIYISLFILWCAKAFLYIAIDTCMRWLFVSKLATNEIGP